MDNTQKDFMAASSSTHQGENEDDDEEHKIVESDPSGRFERYAESLGKGAYKEVFKAFDEEEGVEVAWNQLRVDHLRKQDAQRILSEIQILQSLRNDNIINLYHAWGARGNDGKERVCFITELMTSGTLKAYLRKTKGPIKPKVLKSWCRQILLGLHYLHTRSPPIIHRDLKCENIFINGNNGQAKIGDLGLAIVKSKDHLSSVLGTPEFMAPEFYDEKYDEKVDIYAFGMVVIEIVTKEYPYAECTNQAQIYKKVSSGVKPQALQKVLDPETKSFIEQCIIFDPNQRPSAAELLQNPFFRVVGAGTGPVSVGGSNINTSQESLLSNNGMEGGLTPINAASSPSSVGMEGTLGSVERNQANGSVMSPVEAGGAEVGTTVTPSPWMSPKQTQSRVVSPTEAGITMAKIGSNDGNFPSQTPLASHSLPDLSDTSSESYHRIYQSMPSVNGRPSVGNGPPPSTASSGSMSTPMPNQQQQQLTSAGGSAPNLVNVSGGGSMASVMIEAAERPTESIVVFRMVYNVGTGPGSGSKEIRFPFNLPEDTATDVVSEMVKENLVGGKDEQLVRRRLEEKVKGILLLERGSGFGSNPSISSASSASVPSVVGVPPAAAGYNVGTGGDWHPSNPSMGVRKASDHSLPLDTRSLPRHPSRTPEDPTQYHPPSHLKSATLPRVASGPNQYPSGNPAQAAPQHDYHNHYTHQSTSGAQAQGAGAGVSSADASSVARSHSSVSLSSMVSSASWASAPLPGVNSVAVPPTAAQAIASASAATVKLVGAPNSQPQNASGAVVPSMSAPASTQGSPMSVPEDSVVPSGETVRPVQPVQLRPEDPTLGTGQTHSAGPPVLNLPRAWSPPLTRTGSQPNQLNVGPQALPPSSAPRPLGQTVPPVMGPSGPQSNPSVQKRLQELQELNLKNLGLVARPTASSVPSSSVSSAASSAPSNASSAATSANSTPTPSPSTVGAPAVGAASRVMSSQVGAKQGPQHPHFQTMHTGTQVQMQSQHPHHQGFHQQQQGASLQHLSSGQLPLVPQSVSAGSGAGKELDTPRVIPASRRPDGTLRKEIKIRAGYVPLEEVEKYSNARIEASKVPVGYVPGLGVKTPEPSAGGEGMSKSAKKNAKRKANKAKEEGSVEAPKSKEEAVSAAVPTPSESGGGLADTEKKLKGLRKKLRQIEDLEAKDASTLLPEQKEKVTKKAEILDEIQELETLMAKMGV
ncbi:Serine/threonine-protein kinase wnk8 [Dinochytrium kinnereticum]|nr:Serine/threonine-protein kinase wnk8 [Dinochytrium kinnereticum]